MPYSILIAEDEKQLSALLELSLKSEGYDVTVESNGEAIIKALESKKFDLLLLDIIMPKKNGFEVLESLKEKNIKLPILVISNLSQQEDFERAKALGAQGFIIKSEVSLEEIIKRTKEILNKK